MERITNRSCARYKELGEAAAKEAAAELASATLGQSTASGESGWILAGRTLVEPLSLNLCHMPM